jgi:hypothetical protein
VSYLQRARERLLPLSLAGTFPEALKEWKFTGSTEDYEQAMETCQLCGQEGLRYHFEIANEFSGSRLDVGSECILRFQVPIFEGETELSPAEARRVLNQHMRRMRLESCIRSLQLLTATENNDILASALEYYQINKTLTPKYANVVFWRLQANKIDHDASFFRVRLDKEKYRIDLKNMQHRDVMRIWKALTPSQRKKAIELGHQPPVE